MNRKPLSPDEWYHCYSRGVDKRTTFEHLWEYERFVELLYLCNSVESIHRSDFSNRQHSELFAIKRGEPLVQVAAYCLMPNHFHLLLKDLSGQGDGISKFMQKLGTAYTMHFNTSRERSGNLFVKPFRSKHVADDRYFKRVAQYIHFNPIEIFEPQWKDGALRNSAETERILKDYMFSSLIDYEQGFLRPESAVLDPASVRLLSDGRPPLAEALKDMRQYYAELN